MKHKITFLFFLYISSIETIFAQDIWIAVRDSVTNNPLPRAVIECLGHNSQGVIKGFANELGMIPLKTKFGAKVIKATYEGYKDKVIPISTTNDTLFIRMVPLDVSLPEISVTASRKMVKQIPKGSIIDLTKIPQSKFWSLMDAAQHIPGIEINPSTKIISYQGKPIALQENGMSATGTAMNSPANQYSAIELVLYDPKSRHEGPILNLVKAKKEEPFWGAVHGWGGFDYQGITPLIGMHHGIQTLEVSASYTMGSMPSSTAYSTMQIPHSRYIWEESSSNKNKSHAAFPAPTIRYTLDFKKHFIDLILSYNKNNTTNISNSQVEEYSENILSSNFTQELFRRAETINKRLEVGYLFTINKSNKLHAKLSVLIPESDANEELSMQGPIISSSLRAYQKHSVEKSTEYFSTISYEYQDQQIGALEGGVKYFNRRLEESLAYTPLLPDGTNPATIENRYINNYQYMAAFASWAKQIKDFSFFCVIKQDYSNDRVSSESNERFIFTSFSPYLSMQQRIGSHGLGLIMKYNEQRPHLTQLSPIVDPSNQNGRTLQKGNPDLRMFKVYSITGTYSGILCKKLETNFSLNYEYTKDPINSYTRIIEGTDIIEATYINLGWKQRVYSNLSLRYPLNPKWNVSFSGSIDWSKNRWDSHEKDYQILGGTLSTDYTLERWQFLATGRYYKSADLQSSQSGYLNSDFSVRYTALPKWSATLGVSNPIPYYIRSNIQMDGDSYQSYIDYKSRQFSVNMTFSYFFGKSKQTKGTKSIVVDDM